MQHNGTLRYTRPSSGSSSRRHSYTKVYDNRKHPIRGLWRRNEKFLARRAPDSRWLFPSPQRGQHDTYSRTFRESLILARTAAKLEKFAFHDCRHFFISMAVMSGIDYLTIARWVGHRDGGC